MNPYQPCVHERNFGSRLREIVWRGHRCVILENERLRVLVVADKGADVLEFLYKPLDVELLWHSYHGLRRAGPERASSPLPEGPFRDQFAGGWYEMLRSLVGSEMCIRDSIRPGRTSAISAVAFARSSGAATAA